MEKTGAYLWVDTNFEELDINQLYQIMHLRSEIFVVEQNCPYLDLDYKDQKAIHLQCYHNKKLIAYCRLFRKGDSFESASIGRVIVSKDYRKFGVGHELMDKAISLIKELFNENEIIISAQLYLKSFYESHDFFAISEPYLEDNIPHIRMKRNK